MLKELGDVVAVNGASWLSEGEVRNISIATLAPNVLCKKHNRLFSPLDSVAGQFFRKLRRSFIDLRTDAQDAPGSVWLMSGEALEAWMLKVALGHYYSGTSSNDGVPDRDTRTIDTALFTAALFEGRWATGAGMYVHADSSASVPIQNKVRLLPLISADQKRFVGIEIRLAEIAFRVVFDPHGADLNQVRAEGWYPRPERLQIHSSQRVHVVALSWATGSVTWPCIGLSQTSPLVPSDANSTQPR